MSSNNAIRVPVLSGALLASQNTTTSGAQFAELRALLDTCVDAKNRHYASISDQDDREVRPEGVLPDDGGMFAAYDSTILNVLNRIDSLLEQPWRWDQNLDALKRSAQEIDVTHALTVEQLSAAKHYGRPCVRYGATTTTHPRGGYIVFVRLSNDPHGVISGHGATVEEAMQRFDLAWNAAVQEMADESPQSGITAAPVEEPKPKPKPQTSPPTIRPPKKPRTTRKGGTK